MAYFQLRQGQNRTSDTLKPDIEKLVLPDSHATSTDRKVTVPAKERLC